MELSIKEKEYLKNLKPIEDMHKGEVSKNILMGLALGGAVAAMIAMPGSAAGFK
jgi:hypothetical protein